MSPTIVPCALGLFAAAIALTGCCGTPLRNCGPCGSNVSEVKATSSTPRMVTFNRPLDVLASLTAPATAGECRACAKESVPLDSGRVCEPIRAQAASLMACYCAQGTRGAFLVRAEFDVGLAPQMQALTISSVPESAGLVQCVQHTLLKAAFCSRATERVHVVYPISFDPALAEECDNP